MRIKKTLAVLLLMATMLTMLVSCVAESDADLLASIPPLDESEKESKEEEVKDPDPAEGQTAMPKVTQCYNINQTQVLIAGTCEENATINVSAVGGGKSESVANGTNFAITVDVGEQEATNVQITATAEGKTASEMRVITAGYVASEAGNTVNPTLLFDKIVLFLKKTLDVTDSSAIRTNTALNTFCTLVNSYVNTINIKKYDTEVIYVLIPSKYSINPELAGVENADELNKVTLFTQAKGILEASDATVIDLTEALKAAGDDYPLYYRTYSAWSEYAAFIGYTEVMNYIAQKYPAAAPRPITEFDIKETVAQGGDLAYYLGLDRAQFTETVYDLVPKFDLNIGDKLEVAEGEEDKSHLISDVQQYIDSANGNFLPCNEYFASKEVTPITSVYADAEVGFYTGRADLPTALIYRDDYSIPMFDMLAERFNNSLFMSGGVFNVNVGKGVPYAAEGKGNVDYIIVFASEENLTTLIPAQ